MIEAATKVKGAERPAARLLEALSMLAGLMDRVIDEVKALDGAYQERMLQAVHDTEAALQVQAQEHLERSRQEVVADLTHKFQLELHSSLEALKEEFNTERSTLNMEVRQAVDAAAKLEIERSRLISELDRVQQETGAELEMVRAEAADSKSKAEQPPVAATAVTDEITAVEARLKEVLAIIDNPATELSAVIRKNVEKSELEAYLKGIRFAASGGKE
jgi:hypothetical protein